MQPAQRKPIFRNLLVSGAILTATAFTGCMPCEDKLAELSRPGITLRYAGSLEKRVEELVEALGDKCERVRKYAANDLVKIGKPAIPALIEMLENDGRFAYEAAKVLGKIGDERAIWPLISSMEAQRPGNHAQEALCAIGKPTVLQLIGLLNHNKKEMRSTAAELLGCIKDAQAVPALTGALKDKEHLVRGRAFGSLFHIAVAHPEHDWSRVMPILVDILKDDVGEHSHSEHESAKDTLSVFGKPAIPPLIGLVENNEGKFTRIRALESLGQLAQKHPDTDWSAYLPALARALNDKDDYTRSIAEDTVAKIGKHALPMLFDVLRGKIPSKYYVTRVFEKLKDARAANALMKAYRDENEDVRLAAVTGLGSIGVICGSTGYRNHSTSFDILVEALDDKSRSVRGSAIVSLGKIGDISAVPHLAKLLFCDLDIIAVSAIRDIAIKHPRHEIFAEVVPDLIRKLTRNLHYKDFPLLTQTRVYAAEALGYIGDKRALPELKEMAQNDSDAKSEAEEAIRRILK
jgi:HEAT repeat protein